MSSLMRRFVHLIVDDLKVSYTLRRIDTSPLFAGARKDLGLPTVRLPRPVVCFDFPDKHDTEAEFFLLGNRIVSVKDRRTILFDTLTSTMCIGPDLQQAKGPRSAWAAVQGQLYLANASADDYNKPCFEALRFDDCLKAWSWNLLPSPPFSHDPFERHTMINSFAAAGDGKNIWVSTKDEGTFTFDITTAAWCKEGDWTLPFEGQLQYIPDYNLCFGFCKDSNNLCSTDLIAGASEPPVHMDVWEDVDGYNGAKGWHLACSYLTYLGAGRFCVTRFYDTRPGDECFVPLCDVAVMTGVEVKHSSSTGKLRVTKGASRCYKFAPDTLSGWVL